MSQHVLPLSPTEGVCSSGKVTSNHTLYNSTIRSRTMVLHW
uniref:Uncharacterized protein n=1 Tax=Anguilla anguilla TaxID=7936 RepID=A0A0E9U315_ANGAN